MSAQSKTYLMNFISIEQYFGEIFCMRKAVSLISVMNCKAGNIMSRHNK